MSNLELLPINVAGEWRLGGGDVYESLYPATGEVIARLRAASLADVQEAIAGADRAFRTSGWAQKLPHERAALPKAERQLVVVWSQPPPRKTRIVPELGPTGTRPVSPDNWAAYQSRHHSHTLPCISYRPQAFGR